MAKQLIPLSIVLQCTNLSLDHITATMEGGGADVQLTSAKFLGMMSGGSFVYECEGTYFVKVWHKDPGPAYTNFDLVQKPWPAYLAEFKLKVKRDKRFVKGFKEAYSKNAARRVLEEEFVLCWD